MIIIIMKTTQVLRAVCHKKMFDQNLPMCDKILSAVGHDDQTDQIFNKTVILQLMICMAIKEINSQLQKYVQQFSFLSDQNTDLVRDESFLKRKIICLTV